MTKLPNHQKGGVEDAAMQRMDEVLKAALKMPPRKHKDEPKRRRRDKGATQD